MKAKIIFFIPVLLLLAALVLKLATIPNQLLLIGVAFVFILICLIIFLLRKMKSALTFGRKLIHILFFLLIVIVILLPFAGILKQGIIPIVIYSLLVLSVMTYLIRTNENNGHGVNFLSPNNYRFRKSRPESWHCCKPSSDDY